MTNAIFTRRMGKLTEDLTLRIQLGSMKSVQRMAIAFAAVPRTLRTLLWTIACVWLFSFGAAAQVDIAPMRFPLTTAGVTLQLAYAGNRPLHVADSTVERIVLAMHSAGYDAMLYYERSLRAARLVPNAEQRTLIIAPQILTEDILADNAEPNLLFWTYGFWGELSASTQTHQRAAAISSFEAIDRLLAQVANTNRFPNLKQVVIWGHSGGGQFVNRFAVFSQFENTVAAPQKIRVRYVVMNPSSYVHFDGARRDFATGAFRLPDEQTMEGCPGWNRYGYGMEGLASYPYLAAVGAEKAIAQYATREVVYLVGALDNYQDGSMSTTCASMLQGNFRLDRAENYYAYLQYYFGSSITNRQSFGIVPGVAHDGGGMLLSELGLTYVFDSPPAPIKFVDARAPDGGDGRTWTTAFNSLDDALEFSRNGDEIRVAAGVYTPSVPADSTDPRTASFILPRNRVLKLRGGYNGRSSADPDSRSTQAATVLSGDRSRDDHLNRTNDNAYVVVIADAALKESILDGFTIEAGVAFGSTNAFVRAGGLHILNGHLTITNCQFRHNSGTDGGAVHVRSGATPEFVNCQFTGNHTSTRGGGVVISSASPTFRECLFLTNTAADGGGGVRMRNGGQPVFEDSTWFQNSAPVNGGAVSSVSNEATFARCRFVANTAGVGGGAIFLQAATNGFISCLFNANHAARFGGAIYNSLSVLSVEFCTIYSNTAASTGGGLYSNVDALTNTIANSILWNHRDSRGSIEAAQLTGAALSVCSSLVQNLISHTQSGNLGGFPAHQPAFVDPDGPDNIRGTRDDDFALLPTSICIDAGSSSRAVYDLDGVARPLIGKIGGSARFDIGAKEFAHAQFDTDSDLMSDADEVLAGSSPTDATSRFELRAELHSSGSIALTWPMLGGRTYNIYSAPTPDGPFRLEPLLPSTTTSGQTHIPATSPRTFYRIHVTRP